MTTQVPPSAPARDLAVTLEPHQIRVASKCTKEVYLQGQLERGIVPHDSVWMHGSGVGEDGFLLLLRKMNLELLSRCRQACSGWVSEGFDDACLRA